MEKRYHHQQFTARHEAGVLNDNERPLHHTRASLKLGNLAATEYKPRIHITVSREEALLQEAKAARLEQDRDDIVNAAYRAQGELKSTIIEQPAELVTNPALYVDKDGQPHNN